MIRASRRALAAWMLCAAALAGGAFAEPLPCPATPTGGEEDGIGGTGFGDEDGIGGTGFGDEDGIGGTGIYGVITGLGSVCVNGLHVGYDEEVEVLRDGAPVEAAALGVGQVVWLVAQPDGDRLVTGHIEIRTALRGPVSGVSAAGRVRVAGVEVELANGSAAGPLAVGESVELSGLWKQDGGLLATRVDRLARDVEPRVMPRLDLARRARDLARLAVEGLVATGSEAGRPSLHGLALAAPPADLPRAGERIWLRGRLTPAGRLAVDRVQRPGPRPAPRPPRPTPPPKPPDMVDDTPPEPPPRPKPAPAPRPVRPERIERPTTIDRIEPVERTDSLR